VRASFGEGNPVLAQYGYNGGVVVDQPIIPGADGPDYSFDTSRPVTVRTYLPLLQAGGFLVMDDVSWPSVEPAVREAEKHAKLLMRRVSADKADDYAVLRKPGGPDAMALGLRLRLVARM
jgi:hypothetical protein